MVPSADLPGRRFGAPSSFGAKETRVRKALCAEPAVPGGAGDIPSPSLPVPGKLRLR
jgi:hypothetical protein